MIKMLLITVLVVSKRIAKIVCQCRRLFAGEIANEKYKNNIYRIINSHFEIKIIILIAVYGYLSVPSGAKLFLGAPASLGRDIW